MKMNREHRIGETKVANKYRERSLTFIAIRELHIKKHQNTLSNTSDWPQSNNRKYWQGYGATGTHISSAGD